MRLMLHFQITSRSAYKITVPACTYSGSKQEAPTALFLNIAHIHYL